MQTPYVIVSTDGGTYLGYLISHRSVVICEVGVDGIVDAFHPQPRELPSIETLQRMVVEWVFEMRRGEQVLRARLSTDVR